MNILILRAQINRSSLSKSHKRVALHIVKSGADSVFVGIARTAKKLNLSASTVRLAFRALESAGCLKLLAEERDGCVPCIYSLHPKSFKNLPRDPAEIIGVSVSRRNHRGQTPPKSSGITRASAVPVKLIAHQGGRK